MNATRLCMRIPFVWDTTLHEEVWQQCCVDPCRTGYHTSPATSRSDHPLTQRHIPGEQNSQAHGSPRINIYIYMCVLTCTFNSTYHSMLYLNTAYIFPLQFSPAVSVLNIIINENIKNNATK